MKKNEIKRKSTVCPYCGHSEASLYGKVKNIQRYKCKNCKKTYRETSGTPLFRMHKPEHVEKYIEAMRMGMSVRKAAKYAGISDNTSHIWRHKILAHIAQKKGVDNVTYDSDLQILTKEYLTKGKMKPEVVSPDPQKEYKTPENCSILEAWNTKKDEDVSIAQARVKPGETTELHKLKGTVERYVILRGEGVVSIGNMDPVEVTMGDIAIIPADTPQKIENTGTVDLLFYCICTPRFKQENYIIVEDAFSIL